MSDLVLNFIHLRLSSIRCIDLLQQAWCRSSKSSASVFRNQSEFKKNKIVKIDKIEIIKLRLV